MALIQIEKKINEILETIDITKKIIGGNQELTNKINVNNKTDSIINKDKTDSIINKDKTDSILNNKSENTHHTETLLSVLLKVPISTTLSTTLTTTQQQNNKNKIIH